MKKFTDGKLKNILNHHALWLEDDSKGQRANLRCADLSGANLSGANLRCADLSGANLSDANLRCADLWGANLSGAHLWDANLSDANLSDANLRCANLRCANLSGANLRCANLRCANLWGANLSGAHLWGANLSDANLSDANLRCAHLWGANLSDANLWGAKNITYAMGLPPIACPEKGSFTAFKKANGYIIELFVPSSARRSSATSRKCRCDKAKVVSITNIDGSPANISEIASSYDKKFIYRIGEYVEEPKFYEDRWYECAPGIHFFITRQEAVEYIC